MYYEITGTNVRLLGSMHLVPTGEQAVPEWARRAYAWCKELVIEHDPPTLLPFFKANTPLESLFSTTTYSALKAIWPKDGPLFPLSQLRPWAALLGLAALSHTAIQGIEPNFLTWARSDGKPVQYLELASVVSQAFDTANTVEIEASLQFLLSSRHLVQQKLIEMHSAWLMQDRSQFFAIASTAPLFSQPSLKAAVLERRNRAWVPVIESLLPSKQPILVVVGALHLCGRESLPELLGRPIAPVPSVGSLKKHTLSG